MAGAPAIAIIGAGFGGIGMAARLLRAGFGDVTVFEKADRIGGVWAANSYPGAACDIPAALYILGAVRRTAVTGTPLAVRPEVQQRFVDWVQERIAGTVWAAGCTSWYRTASGRNTTNWPDFSLANRWRTRRFDPSKYATPA